MHVRRPAALLAAALAFPLAIGAAPVPAPIQDVRESYQLLARTYYAKVDPQQMLDSVHDVLADFERKHGVRNVLPPLRDSGDPEANVDVIADAIDRVQAATHESPVDVAYAAIAAMAGSVHDRYTTFFTPDEYRKFNTGLDPEKISGIGVLTQPDPATKLLQAYYVVPGTPADRAGVQAGDLFASIDGTSTRGLAVDDASKLLRGKAGSSVTLSLIRGGKTLAPLTLTRADVRPPTVIFRMLPDRVAYIWIMEFGRETPQEFATALDRAEHSGVRAYVVDLRNDTGGYVQSALDISSKFVDGDPLLTIEQRGEQAITVPAEGRPVPSRPTVLLVNKYTASASEITAGALQDDGIAVLVGEKTFGKGVMQSLTELPDGAAIKITTAHYLTPKNRDINLKGITPDYDVPENPDARFGEVGHDAQLRAALTILSKKIAQVRP